MYYLEWLILMGAGVTVSITLFIWALRSGQFAEQKRARYLPLEDAVPGAASPPAKRMCAEVYVCLCIIGIWLCAMASMLYFIFKR